MICICICIICIYICIYISRWWFLKYFWNFHPDPWGFMIQFDLRIFFKWVGEKPPTRKWWSKTLSNENDPKMWLMMREANYSDQTVAGSRSPQNVVKSKGIPPKCPENSGLGVWSNQPQNFIISRSNQPQANEVPHLYFGIHDWSNFDDDDDDALLLRIEATNLRIRFLVSQGGKAGLDGRDTVACGLYIRTWWKKHDSMTLIIATKNLRHFYSICINLENKLLLISINFTSKTQPQLPKKMVH